MDEQTSPDPTTATASPTRPGLRDRVLGWRGVAGVALASVILGGAGGALLGVVSDAGDDRTGMHGPGGVGGPGGPPTGMMPGQPAPTTGQQRGDQRSGSPT
jgi:hypothetical protein